MEFFILFVTGLSVGIVSAFFGIGGGAIMVPVLYMLFPSLPPASIISISLGTIVLNTALNNWRFYKNNLAPSSKSIALILACSLLGALVGARLLYTIDATTLKKLFGFILLVIAIRTITSKKKLEDHESYTEHPLALSFTCLFGSFISSITGLGGGAIFVPLLMGLVKLPIKLVSPYSNMAMMAASFVGLLPHLFNQGSFNLSSDLASSSFIGHVNILFILCLFFGAYISSKLGHKLHSDVSAKTKKRLLSALLFALAIKILLG